MRLCGSKLPHNHKGVHGSQSLAPPILKPRQHDMDMNRLPLSPPPRTSSTALLTRKQLTLPIEPGQRLATGWTVRRSNSGLGEIFRTCPDRPLGPPSLLYNGYRIFPGGNQRPGREANPSPHPTAVVMKDQSYSSTHPMGRTTCTESQCLYKGALYLYFTH